MLPNLSWEGSGLPVASQPWSESYDIGHRARRGLDRNGRNLLGDTPTSLCPHDHDDQGSMQRELLGFGVTNSWLSTQFDNVRITRP
jgi:hypothetical protein